MIDRERQGIVLGVLSMYTRLAGDQNDGSYLSPRLVLNLPSKRLTVSALEETLGQRHRILATAPEV